MTHACIFVGIQLLTLTICQYKARYIEMYGNASDPPPKSTQSYPGASRRLGTLLRDISDDSSDEDDDDANVSEGRPRQLVSHPVVGCTSPLILYFRHHLLTARLPRYMGNDILYGHPLPVTTFPLWHHQHQVSGPFHRLESPSASVVTGSNRTSSKRCST